MDPVRNRWLVTGLLTVPLLVAPACDDSAPADTTAGSGTDAADDDDNTAPDPDAGTDGDSSLDDGDDTGSTGANDDDDDGAVDGSDDGGESGDSGPPPAVEPVLPSVTSRCPDIASAISSIDVIDLEIHPAGLSTARTVRFWGSAQALEGPSPLVMYWHGTGSDPNEALWGLGEDGVASIVAAGGIVIAPHSDPNSGTFPWYSPQSTDADLLVVDEAVACLHEQVGLDTHRIHSAGFSAGGIQTMHLSWMRSNYLASVVSYSGGQFEASHAPDANPDNLLSAMIIHGGAGDVWMGSVGFTESSELSAASLQAVGKFAILCEHGDGHWIPEQQSTVIQFISDHPWGTSPSPYESGFPGLFPPGYCWIP